MLIGEFARRAGITRDAVRLYVRKGLLTPTVGSLGGRMPYRHFSEAQLRHIRMMRIAQSCGLSLKQLASLKRESDAGRLDDARMIEVSKARLADLEAKAASLGVLIDYLRRNVTWLEQGREGPEPEVGQD